MKAQHDNGVVAYLWNHQDEPKAFHITTNLRAENVMNLVEMASELAGAFGFNITDHQVDVVEKEIAKEYDRTKESKLEGKVEAYEKILIGRAINASK